MVKGFLRMRPLTAMELTSLPPDYVPAKEEATLQCRYAPSVLFDAQMVRILVVDYGEDGGWRDAVRGAGGEFDSTVFVPFGSTAVCRVMSNE